MKHENEVRELLLDNAVYLVAQGGFERATTKELAFCGGSLPNLKMNEVYIYRLFGSKEALLEQAFVRTDREIFAAIKAGASAFDGFVQNTKEKLYKVFLATWQFTTENEQRCRYYVRYYYCANFKGNVQQQHQKLFSEVIGRLLPIFKDEADAVSVLHSIFTALLDFAVRVYNGELDDKEENRNHIFNVLYCMMATYLKNA